MKRGWTTVMGLMLLTALTGCSGLVTTPTVTVRDVQAATLGLTGGTLELTLEVDNPNRFTLAADSFTYRLQLADEAGAEDPEWTELFDGTYPQTVELPAGESTVVSMEVPFRYASVGTVVARLLAQGEVEYRFSGLFRFRFLAGGVNVPFDERGTFRP